MEIDEYSVTIRSELERLNQLHSEFPSHSRNDFKFVALRSITHSIVKDEYKKNIISREQDPLQYIADEILFGLPNSNSLDFSGPIHDKILKAISNLSTHMKIDMATQYIDELTGWLIGISDKHPPIVSAMVGAIQSTLDNTQLYEVHPTTAHISLGKHNATQFGSFPILLPQIPLHKYLIELKLRLHKIIPKFIHWDEIEALYPATYVVDYPGHPTSGIPVSEIGTLEELADRGLTGRVMLVTTSSKGSKPAFAQPLIGTALHSYSLDALIDFTSYSASNKPTDYSLIILSNTLYSTTRKRNFISIDVSRNNKLVEHLDPIERALLAGHIYNIWQGRKPDYDTNSVTGRVKRIIRAQFSDGFENVKNLCLEQPVEKIIGSHRLAARGYFPPDDGRGDLSGFLIDSGPAITPLLEEKQPHCMYVIGNNGQGKSLLLRDLAYKLAAARKKSVGISFSISDRFPFNSHHLKRYFKYDGARTGEDVLSLNRRSQGITKKVASIFKEQSQLDLFSSCLEILDFEPRHYFARKNIRTLEIQDSRESNYVLLSHDADENKLPAPLGSYEFAIVRSDGENRITPFSNLSSGEQNILILLIKLIDAAKEGKVILLDEPEISLHVKWQQALPSVLTEISAAFGASIVVATHSPILIANAGIDNLCFLASGGALLEIPPNERSSVETIILDGFKTYTPHNREVHEKCARLVAEIIHLKNSTQDDEIVTDAITRLDELQDLLKNSTANSDPARLKADLDLISKAKVAIATVLGQGVANG